MIDEKKREPAEGEERRREVRRVPYEPPRLVKKRPVSRATLFTGSGPDSGGVIGSN